MQASDLFKNRAKDRTIHADVPASAQSGTPGGVGMWVYGKLCYPQGSLGGSEMRAGLLESEWTPVSRAACCRLFAQYDV